MKQGEKYIYKSVRKLRYKITFIYCIIISVLLFTVFFLTIKTASNHYNCVIIHVLIQDLFCEYYLFKYWTLTNPTAVNYRLYILNVML